MRKPRVSQTSHPRYKWRVFFSSNGGRKNRFFATKAEAQTFARQQEAEHASHGATLASMPGALRAEALRCAQKLAAVNATITDATEFFMRHAKPSGGARTVTAAVADFLTAKAKAGRRPEYLRIQKSILENFGRTFGERALHEIGSGEIAAWLESQEWTLRTRKNVQRDLHGWFSFCARNGFCTVNPLDRLELPQFDEPAPGILTVNQAGALLANAEPDIVPYLAIGLFAGLRTAEIEKLDWSEIDLAEPTIEVKGHKAKTRARRIVELSENLVVWLRPLAKLTGPVTPKAARAFLHRARKAAGVKNWPHNALRHSFASYHLAAHKNAAATALQLGHYNTNQLFASYRELVKPKDAERYWKIAPSVEAEAKIVAMA